MSTLSLLAAGPLNAPAQTTVTVNPHQPWIGFMNVFGLNGDGTPNYGAFQFNSSWGPKDLRANFDATGTNYVTLTGCTNVWEISDTYWVQANHVSPNKWMDASFYVENNNIAGQYVTFTGVCLSNNLAGNATSLAFIKDFTPNYSANTPVTVALVPGQPFTLSLQTTAGDHIQWGFETQGPDVNPTNLVNSGSIVIATDNTNVSLLPLASLALIEGQKATFAVTNVGDPATSYQWTYSPDSFSLYPLSDGLQGSGSTIYGSATSTLIVSNVTLGDIGYYIATVANNFGTAQESASLGVQPKSPQIKTNMLVDPGFEGNAFSPSSASGWYGYNGVEFQSTNNFYPFSPTPVAVHDGTNCLHTYSSGAGSYNGAFQDRPAVPGTVYTANAWFLTPSADPITDVGACYLEVQFRNAGGTVLRDYKSASITTNSPLDTWINLTPTNIYAGDFTTLLGTSPYMIAPPGSATVRFQITHFAGATGGSVYEDTTDLRLRSPVASTVVSGHNVQIGFPTVYGPIYDVLYKTNLTDTTWKLLKSVTGDATPASVTDPVGSKSRFYNINTE